MRSYVSYLRVSTDRQGRSGLGLEAQREAISQFVKQGRLLREYIEVESGGRADRPELALALEHCRDTGAVLIIAKLDRLARSVAVISQLLESDIEFVAADFPQANRLTIHLLAAVAGHKREMISRRTREALAAAKARGGAPRRQQSHLRRSAAWSTAVAAEPAAECRQVCNQAGPSLTEHLRTKG